MRRLSEEFETRLAERRFKEMLGHANVSQTSTYLNAGKMGLHDSMQRFEGILRNPVASEQQSGYVLTGDIEKQETPKSLVN